MLLLSKSPFEAFQLVAKNVGYISSFDSNRINCLIILLSSSRFSQTQRSPHVFYRHDLINQLQHNHALVTLVAENLATYMESMRLYARGMC